MTDELIVTARPVRSARTALVVAAVLLALFVVIAIVMPHDNAGAAFDWKDQLGTGILGLILAAFVLVLTRPRLRADSDGLTIRGYLAPERTIPWDIVLRVEFPVKLRFARLVLPGDETIALVAVQRMDRAQSVAVMRGLRRLHAQAHPAAA